MEGADLVATGLHGIQISDEGGDEGSTAIDVSNT